MGCYGQYSDHKGRDAVHLYHEGVRVTDIYEINNPFRESIYSKQNTELQQKATNEKYGRLLQISKTHYKNQDALLTENYRIQSNVCNRDINETFLFHGTSRENINSIAQEGFELKREAHGSMYGRVVYLAESSEKADQYAGKVIFSFKNFNTKNKTFLKQ